MDLFSNLMVMSECLLDTKRTETFKKAINEVVKAGDVVLDVGTGSGILSLFAARAGARKVYSLEYAPEVAVFARQNVEKNGLEDVIQVINVDALKFRTEDRVDVVIMEMMDTGLVSEQQGIAVKSLKDNGVIGSSTKFIPHRFFSACDLVNYDFSFFGFNMYFIIQARNYASNSHVIKKLSRVKVYDEINFLEDFDLKVNKEMEVRITEDGELNALRLQSKVELSDSVSTWGTSDMNMPVIVPLIPKKVRVGDLVRLGINYSMGEGFGNFKASIID